MTVRAAWRGVLLISSLLICFLRFGWIWITAALRGRRVSLMQRAEWMRFCGRLVLASMGIHSRVEGELPKGVTVIVANHLSYLDIVIAAAAFPCIFVARHDVVEWPVFGVLSRLGGTIYLDRASRASAWEAVDMMALRLAEGAPVLFFPEGTSTDGSQVIRFHSTLFAAAVEAALPVTPAAISYETCNARSSGMITERDLCWFGDDLFLPHLLRVLGVTGFTAVVRFGAPEFYPDRRTAAWRSHDAVEAMRARSLVNVKLIV